MMRRNLQYCAGRRALAALHVLLIGLVAAAAGALLGLLSGLVVNALASECAVDALTSTFPLIHELYLAFWLLL
ncbi:hypothetical protein [Serratia rubidaea]|uniref:hypothetical protein n=1 Tax=Serratia rubidaea TaxID=61652 RepID=UPI0017860F1E|nr:hypothetical protein [Serratia rubidaea]MBD8453640.1 hypothetical protein [Serratia rubidaea]